MKKLLMSLVAVVAMSSATFASTGEKKANKTIETTTVYKAVTGKSDVKVVGEAKEIKVGKLKRLCRLTVSIYNTSGQLIDTQVLTYTTYGASDMFYSNCGEFFSATMQNYQNYYGNGNR